MNNLKNGILIVAFVLFATLMLSACNAEQSGQNIENGQIAQSQEIEESILPGLVYPTLGDPNPLSPNEYIAGVYRWMGGYRISNTFDNRSPISPEELFFGGSMIYTFTLDGRVRIELNNPFDERHYLRFLKGNYTAERLDYTDSSLNALAGFTGNSSRADRSWFFLVLTDVQSFGPDGTVLPEHFKLDTFISFGSDGNVIFHWPDTGIVAEYDIDLLQKITPAINGGIPHDSAIIGTFSDSEFFESSTTSFEDLPGHKRKTYTFNDDSSFEIASQVSPRSQSYQGSFNLEEISVDDIDEGLVADMSQIVERSAYSLFRITAYNVQGTLSEDKLILYVSIADDDDVVIYNSTLNEIVAAKRLW